MKLFSSGSLARNASWILLGQGLSIICQGFYFILLARLLGSTEYGIYVGAFAMVSILSVYSPLGSQFTLLRHVSAEPAQFAPYWGNVLTITLALGTIMVGLLTWIVPHLAHSYSSSMVLCVALGECICAQLTLSAGRVFQAFENMRITAILNLLTNLLRTLLAGLMVWLLHHGTAQQWAVMMLAISAMAACIAITVVTKEYGWPCFSRKLLRLRAGEGTVFALSASTTNVYNDFDKAMLGHYGMNIANGIYTMAYRVIDVACTPFGAIQSAAFPRFFKKGIGGVQSTSEYAIKIVKRTAPLALLSAAVIVIVAPIIPYLAGRSFGESVAALRWLALLPFFRSLHMSAGDAITGAGYQKLRLSTQAGAAMLNFALNLYLIPRYGWYGAAWASLSTDGMLVALNWAVLLSLKSEEDAF